jgi:hypothetical protein
MPAASLYKPGRSWPLYVLPLIASVAPLVTLITTYIISASKGQIPVCLPLLEGCTSISAAGRQVPSIFVFRALMIPAAVMLGLYWALTLAWVRRQCSGQKRKPTTWIVAVGICGAFFLMMHAVFLGGEGESLSLLRRFSVALFFGLTLLAELMQVRWLLFMRRIDSVAPLWLPKALLWIGALTLVLGVGSLAVSAAFHKNEYNNIAAWNLMVLLYLHVLLTAFGWRATGFRISFAFPERR